MRALLAIVIGCLLLGVPSPAHAVTLEDIVALSRAGLGDEVLVALIETSDSVFTMEAAELLELKSGGVSDRVILALVRKGRTAPPAAPPAPAAAAPPVVIVEDDDPPPVPVVVAMPVLYPVFVPQPLVPIGAGHHPYAPRRVRRSGRFINDGFGTIAAPTPVGEPVYWGWGGTLRPDAWGQPRGGSRAPEGSHDSAVAPRARPRRD